MSDINVMDFVEAMNVKNAEVEQANKERERLYQELTDANKRTLEFVDEVDKLRASTKMLLDRVADLEFQIDQYEADLREANKHKESLRELLSGF